jgi:UDP-2,3-diacylglucosamine hydrolase
VALFLGFCRDRAAGADALYILGDLFDAWIGDDNDAPPGPAIRAALADLTRGGTPVYLQHGNRDFLIGNRFCTQTGVQLLPEEAVVDLHGHRMLLMHGDTLCTGDLAYQQARLKLRDPAFVREFLARPLVQRVAIAAGYRRQSGEATSLLAADIMDVNQAAVEAAMARHGVQRLVHGHTHREARHRFGEKSRPLERIVLGEWHPDRGPYLQVSPRGIAAHAWQ